MFYDAVLTNIKKNSLPKSLKLLSQENGRIPKSIEIINRLP